MLLTLINPYFNTEQTWKGSHTVNVTQLEVLNRTSILQYLIRNEKIPPEMGNRLILTHNPRNYYIDVLMAKNYELYYDQDQLEEDPLRMKRLLKLPLTLEIAAYDEEHVINCKTEIITSKHFNILQKIGEGTYAEIFLVEKKEDRSLYCMKRINKAECREKGELSMIKSQFEVLELPSKYKVKIYYQFEDYKYVYFILEYCPHGDLYSIIKNNKKAQESAKLTLTDKYTIWIQIAFGIVKLHQAGIIYRDLKPQNILLNQNGEIKICDFGFACKIEPNQKFTALCGSYEYLAPQMVKRQGYNTSLDIYCLGLLFYELLVGSNPFEGITPQTILEMKGKTINFDKKSINNTVRDLLKKFFKEKPEERIGYDSSLQIFRHEFFKENEDLVVKIINNKVIIKNLKYVNPPSVKERQELDEKEVYIFSKGIAFNYMKPFFNVTQNIGPKFHFTK